jgi:hypothetical protein
MFEGQRAALAAVLTALACGGLACGTEEPAGEQQRTAPVVGQGLPQEVGGPITAAIDRLQRAFLANDFARLCRDITPTAAREAGTAAHGTATTCRRDLRRLFGLIRKGGGWRHRGAPRVVDVESDGNTAVATVALDRRWKARIPLRRDGGRWRLSGLFGAGGLAGTRAREATQQAEFPPAGARGVAASGTDGEPCPDLSDADFSDADFPLVSGGCRIKLSTPVVPLTILTPFGDFEFERCSLDMRVNVDASGRTWNSYLQVGSGPKSLACGDVNECYDLEQRQLIPWRGRITPGADGSFVHRIDMCLQTCVGYFVGELKIRLIPEDDGWRAEPIDGGGETGFRFDSPLRVQGDLGLEADDA